jgi:glycine cleavage system H lipoate-binding protein
MTCPFLRETQVKYCGAATVRKLIPLAQASGADEKCSTDRHTTCAAWRTMPQGSNAEACPYLRESLMQYCAAAPIAKFVPYSESMLSRCGNDGFRYCELFLAMARPRRAQAEPDSPAPAPPNLRFSQNHMWVDVSEDGLCHAGIDAFLSRALGNVERISYVWLQGRHRPATVLTVNGMDLEMVFPNPFLITRCNLYLRANPDRLTAEPYGGGWLFEGVAEPDTTLDLVEGPAAQRWMDEEQSRLSEMLQQLTLAGERAPTAADGGIFCAGLLRLLERDQALRVYQEFFSPYAGGKR